MFRSYTSHAEVLHVPGRPSSCVLQQRASTVMSHKLKHAGHITNLSFSHCVPVMVGWTHVCASFSAFWTKRGQSTAHVKHLQLGQRHEQQHVVALQVDTQPSKE